MPSAQLSYALSQPKGIHGAIATLREVGDRSRVFAKRRHVVTIAISGTDGDAADGAYSYQVSTPANFDPLTPVLIEAEADSDTVDELGAALEADHNDWNNGLANVCRAAYSAADDDLVLTAVRAGEPFTVALVGNPSTSMAATTTVDAAETAAKIGYAMADIDGQHCRLLQTGDTAATIAKLGIMVPGRPIEAQDDGTIQYAEGDNLLFVCDGDLWIMPEVDMAVTDPVYVRVVATGNEIPGAIRNTADGSDAVQMTRWRVLEAGGPTSGNPILLGVYP